MVDAGKRLAREKVDVLICGGGPVALSKGSGGDAGLSAMPRQATGLPVVMANGAVLNALRVFAIRSVLVVSPFIEARNQEIKEFLESAGLRVTATRGLGLVKNIDFAMQSSEAAYDLARRLAAENPAADAIYIACPRWPTVEIIEPLEADTGKLVISAAAAMVWGALSALKIRDCQPGYGRLMESLRAARE
jgi:maleate isomerase